MANIHAEFMRKFYTKARLKLPPRDLALAYANYVREHMYWYLRSHMHTNTWGLSANEPSPPPEILSGFGNVSTVSGGPSLEAMTKRSLLVSDAPLLTHYKDRTHKIHHEYLAGTPEWVVPDDALTFYTSCGDLDALGGWLKSCRPLLTRGEIFYLPYITMKQVRINGYTGGVEFKGTHKPLEAPLLKVIANRRTLSYQSAPDSALPESPTGKATRALIQRVATLELPYLHDVDLETFAKLTSDEPEALKAFRHFLRMKLIDLRENEQGEFSETNLAKISFEIQDGVRRLHSDYKRLKMKSAFQASGATLAAVTASLVAVNVQAFGWLPQILGTSGGLLALTKVLAEHLDGKRTLGDSPFYYLWLFSKKIKRPN